MNHAHTHAHALMEITHATRLIYTPFERLCTTLAYLSKMAVLSLTTCSERELKLNMNNVERNNLLLESCIKSNEKMLNTMDKMKDTLVILAESVNQNNKIVNELAINVRALNNKIYNNKKINYKSNINNKSNIFDSLKRTYKALLLSIYQ